MVPGESMYKTLQMKAAGNDQGLRLYGLSLGHMDFVYTARPHDSLKVSELSAGLSSRLYCLVEIRSL